MNQVTTVAQLVIEELRKSMVENEIDSIVVGNDSLGVRVIIEGKRESRAYENTKIISKRVLADGRDGIEFARSTVKMLVAECEGMG